jgi:hypothetical protein
MRARKSVVCALAHCYGAMTMNEEFVDQVEYLGSMIETGAIEDIGEPALSLIEYAETLGFNLKVSQSFTLLRQWRVVRAGFSAAEAVLIASRPSPRPRLRPRPALPAVRDVEHDP